MKLTLIKGFLPWIAFLAFANNTSVGITFGAIIGLICLFLFNRGSLRKKIWLDWTALLFFIAIGVSAMIPWPIAIKLSVLLAYLIPFCVCSFSLLVSPSVALQYARLQMDKTYWNQPIFIRMNQGLTAGWAICLLGASLTVGFYLLNFGSLLWNIKILPTAFLLIAIGFTSIFPDFYRSRTIKRLRGLGSLPNLSLPQFIELDQLSMGYRTVGQGQSILLLPDFFMNAHTWSIRLMQSLSQHFQVILWDYPNMGYSDSMKSQSYSVESLSRFLKGFLAQLKTKPMALLGVGLGGWIAQTFVDRYSDKMKLILINTDRPDGTKAASPQLISWGQAILENKEETALNLLFPESVIPNFSREVLDLWTASRLEGALSKESFDKQCQLIKDWYAHKKSDEKLPNEILLITGLQDQLIPAEATHLLAQHFKKVTQIDFADAGHGVIYQHPEEIANKIGSFLKY